jgi:HEAT repeat protein
MLSRWIEDLESADPNVRSLALRELQQLGPAAREEAVPALIAALQQAQGEPGQRPWQLLYGVVRALEAIGPDARPAVPLLVSLVAQDWLGESAARAILRIGAETAEERLAVRFLLQWHPGGRYCGFHDSVLLDALVDGDDPELRELLRQRADKVMPSLAELLTDADASCRARAAEALACYGPAAKPFVPALVAALNDPIWSVRIEVARALFAAEPERQSEASAALFPLLLNPEAIQEGYSALSQMGADGVAYLRQELRGSSVAGRAGAARALGFLAQQAQDAFTPFSRGRPGPGAAGAAFEDLVAVLTDGAAAVRYAAAQALVRIDASRATPAIPSLVAGLESADAKIRSEATHMLSRLAQAGRPAETALPALSKLLTDPEVRLEAVLALVAIDAGQAVATVPVLVEALERSMPLEIPAYPNSGTSAEAILVALGRIGPPAAVGVPLLRQALQSPIAYVPVRAAVALVRVAPERTTDAVNTLLALVSAVWSAEAPYEVDTFCEAVGALAEIGPAAGKAVPNLEEWLFDEAKRGFWSDTYLGDREPAPLIFSALVKIDPPASARVLAHIEADLHSPERFDQGVKLLLDLAREVPASAPLLARLLEDNRAEAEWDSILSILGGFGPNARDIASVLQEQVKSATPERASRINDVLARIGQPC